MTSVATVEDLKAAHLGCTRFLNGHGPALLRALVEELLAEAGPEERGDVYGDGPLIRDFEAEIAALLGKPAAVFLPSGTLAQQIAARIWSDRATAGRGGGTVAWHPTCHLEIHEERGYQAVHELRARLVGDPRRPIARADLDAIAEPIAMLLLELPQRELGGLLPTWGELQSQVAWARERGVALHLDGARLWECQPFYGKSVAELAAPFDSVYVSFYKILRGVAGAVLAGTPDFVAEARVWQRRLGGNLVSLWPFVLAARAGLRARLPRLAGYRERAQAVARVFAAVDGVVVKPAAPHTNMMHVYLRAGVDTLTARAIDLARRERVQLITPPRETELPGWSRFELTIGDGAAAISDDELAALIPRLVTTAPASPTT